jgi:hypothetical protein
MTLPFQSTSFEAVRSKKMGTISSIAIPLIHLANCEEYLNTVKEATKEVLQFIPNHPLSQIQNPLEHLP